MNRVGRVLLTALIGIFSAPSALGEGTSLCRLREASLDYVLQSQVKSPDEVFRKGEWAATTQAKLSNRMIGAGTKEPLPDANAFTISTIHNLLADIYLKGERNERVLAAIRDSEAALKEHYKMPDGSYDFYPKSVERGGIHIPRNVDKFLWKPFQGVSVLVSDADDTAAAKMAEKLGQLVESTVGNGTTCPTEEEIGHYFSPYRDLSRTPQFYNMFHGDWDTKAYLTWLKDEPKDHLTKRYFAPPEAGQRVSLSKNDVDCIVNTNVVHALSYYGNQRTEGYKEACDFVLKKVQKKAWNACGIFYPQTYWLHYSIAGALEDGASCLKPAAPILLSSLISGQNSNGSWKNDLIKHDETHATAAALGALLRLGNPSDAAQKAKVKKAIEYLAGQAVTANDTSHWKGGVFFGQGIPKRTGLVWRSDALTTALIANDLFEAQRWLPEEFDCKK